MLCKCQNLTLQKGQHTSKSGVIQPAAPLLDVASELHISLIFECTRTPFPYTHTQELEPLEQPLKQLQLLHPLLQLLISTCVPPPPTQIHTQELELRFLYLSNPRLGSWLEDLSGITELRQLRLLRLAGGATPTPAFFEGLVCLKQLRVLEVLPGVYGQIAGYDMDMGQGDAGVWWGSCLKEQAVAY